MNDEWIIETAERYGRLETLEDQNTGCHVSKWVLSEDALLDFARAVIIDGHPKCVKYERVKEEEE